MSFTYQTLLTLNLPIKNCWIALFCIASNYSFAQKKNFEKKAQVSILPGVSTNGLDAGGFTNHFSLNIFSGYSKANMFFEIAGISNANEEKTQGLQIAGIGNITGINAFKGLKQKEKDSKMRSGFEANLIGLQISGLTNIVINNVFGSQLTGGVNVSNGALIGFQLAGLGNTVRKYSFGVQLAGLWNTSVESINGTQISILSNYTRDGLYGLQISLFNRAGLIEGVNSYENDDPTGVQIGIVNKSGKMNGFQIGIVNIAKRSQGTQIGLINIYRNGKDINTRNGTSIGLINCGDFGYVAAYANEVFVQNYEVATGTYYKNARLKEERFNKSIQNSLIYSRGNWTQQELWAIGYGLKKMYFTRSDVPGMGAFRFFGFGADLLHVSHQKTFEKNMSMLAKGKLVTGTKLSPKIQSVYIFGELSMNYYLNDSGKDLMPLSSNEDSSITKVSKWWPGFSLGVMLR